MTSITQISYYKIRPLILIPMFIVATTILSQLLGPAYAKYLLAFYVIIFLLVIVRPNPHPRWVPFLSLYVLANGLAILLHLQNIESVLNAGSLVVSIVSIAGAAYMVTRQSDLNSVDLSLEKWLWISLGASFFISTALTAIKWPTAPVYFPWEAFYTDKRLLLIYGTQIGHTPSLWVSAFLAAFTLHRLASQKRNRLGLTLILGFLVICLIATKSRLALVYILNILVMALAYKKIPITRALVYSLPAIFSLAFLLFSIFPNIGTLVNSTAQVAQQIVGDKVRITPETQAGVTVFSGRDVLNRAMLSASFEKPFQGLGDEADILLYGITREGKIAKDPDQKLANSESVLRLAIKYGWPYFFVLTLFLASIPFWLMRLPRADQVLKVGLWGMCVESIATQGGMEIFYDISGLFLFLLCIFMFEAPRLRFSVLMLQQKN